MTHDVVRSPRSLALALAAALALGLAWPAAAQVGTTDSDGDGVPDAVDQCTDTPAGDLVDATGCSVCPCDGTASGNTWTSHDEYVGCVTTEAKQRRAAGTMKRHAMRVAIKRARQASCGNDQLTRCCVYAHIDPNADVSVGKCRMMSLDACDQLSKDASLDYVEDIGGGNCTPNPCTF